MEEEWKIIKDTVISTAQEVIGFRRGSKKEQWISEGTWAAIDERRSLKAKKEQAFKTKVGIDESIAAYKAKDREVKSRCRADKDIWFGNRVAEGDTEAKQGDSKTLYRIVKELSGKQCRNYP